MHATAMIFMAMIFVTMIFMPKVERADGVVRTESKRFLSKISQLDEKRHRFDHEI